MVGLTEIWCEHGHLLQARNNVVQTVTFDVGLCLCSVFSVQCSVFRIL
nr:MAG TPA: hypothetical protein [Caudoviricetes sp.]